MALCGLFVSTVVDGGCGGGVWCVASLMILFSPSRVYVVKSPGLGRHQTPCGHLVNALCNIAAKRTSKYY